MRNDSSLGFVVDRKYYTLLLKRLESYKLVFSEHHIADNLVADQRNVQKIRFYRVYSRVEHKIRPIFIEILR